MIAAKTRIPVKTIRNAITPSVSFRPALSSSNISFHFFTLSPRVRFEQKKPIRSTTFPNTGKKIIYHHNLSSSFVFFFIASCLFLSHRFRKIPSAAATIIPTIRIIQYCIDTPPFFCFLFEFTAFSEVNFHTGTDMVFLLCLTQLCSSLPQRLHLRPSQS